MSLIMKSGKSSRNKEQRQAYTWAACILVGVFLISIVIPFIGESKNSTGKDYQDRAFDLASLPFTNEDVEAALLSSTQYQDVAKKDLISTLFSKKDKEKRQAEDKAKGVPPPPDEEYKAVADQKEKVAKRKAYVEQRAAARAAAAQATVSGSLRKSNVVTNTASSAASGSIWRADDKARAGQGGGSTIDANKAALLASVKGGRSMGFVDAANLSSKGANSKDLEKAAGSALDAFQKGATEKDKDILETSLEDAAAGLEMDPDAMVKDLSANNIPGLEDAADKLDEKKKDNDRKRDEENCGKNIFKSFPACIIPAGLEILGDVVQDKIKSTVKDAWGSKKKDKVEKSSEG